MSVLWKLNSNLRFYQKFPSVIYSKQLSSCWGHYHIIFLDTCLTFTVDVVVMWHHLKLLELYQIPIRVQIKLQHLSQWLWPSFTLSFSVLTGFWESVQGHGNNMRDGSGWIFSKSGSVLFWACASRKRDNSPQYAWNVCTGAPGIGRKTLRIESLHRN